jgi:hypothetical protein
MSVLPLLVLTVNLLITLLPIVKFPVTALMLTLSLKLVTPSTFRVLSKSTAPLPFRVPSITVLPEAEATVNLSTPPEVLTAKLLSTSRVLLISVVPVITTFLSSRVSP